MNRIKRRNRRSRINWVLVYVFLIITVVALIVGINIGRYLEREPDTATEANTITEADLCNKYVTVLGKERDKVRQENIELRELLATPVEVTEKVDATVPIGP